MKKSKIVAIGLLTLSISACNHRRQSTHRPLNDWDNQPNYYVNNNGSDYYNQGGGISPFWVWYAYSMGSRNGNTYVMNSPGIMYRGHGNKSSFHVSEFNHTSSMSGRSVRGGFGRSSSVSS